MTPDEWSESVGGELLSAGVTNCPGCDGEPCVWNYHQYPLPLPEPRTNPDRKANQ